ncbi:MAG: alpha/beta hydrolase [Actinobacteria bacterium]|nr:alpha/beta hydrolase [Actinomycetota bacterium]
MTTEGGRLSARPGAGDPAAPIEPGLYELEMGADRDGALYVPDADGPRPLLLTLHGATMHAGQMVRPLLSVADEFGIVLLVPDSRGPTWDVIAAGGYGPDIDFLDAALRETFDRCAVDPSAISVGGVSDGASYALSVGVANGDLFASIVAFSPGFIAPPEVVGRPRVFVSHGVHDRILPIDACGRPIVAGLRQADYDVEYLEFDGGHEMPEPVVRAAFKWLVE